MPVPARATFWCHVRLDKVRNHFSVRCFGNAQVTVEKKITLAARQKRRIAGFDMRKRGGGAVQRGEAPVQSSCSREMLHCTKQELFQLIFWYVGQAADGAELFFASIRLAVRFRLRADFQISRLQTFNNKVIRRQCEALTSALNRQLEIRSTLKPQIVASHWMAFAKRRRNPCVLE